MIIHDKDTKFILEYVLKLLVKLYDDIKVNIVMIILCVRVYIFFSLIGNEDGWW